MVSQLVIGNGEVGSALAEVLGVPVRDIEPVGIQADILHIAFGWTKRAEQDVADYVLEHHAHTVVVHSTFPVDAFERNTKWLCSPVRGRHPNLAEGIRTFTKHLGGTWGVTDVKRIFEATGLTVRVHETAAELALAKLVELAQMGVEVAMEKEIYRLSQYYGVDFDSVYKVFGDSYNRGYRDLGEHRFIKPILDHIPGPLGGHCVAQNTPLIKSEFFNKIVGPISPDHWGWEWD